MMLAAIPKIIEEKNGVSMEIDWSMIGQGSAIY